MWIRKVERPSGLEPEFDAWKASVLPTELWPHKKREGLKNWHLGKESNPVRKVLEACMHHHTPETLKLAGPERLERSHQVALALCFRSSRRYADSANGPIGKNTACNAFSYGGGGRVRTCALRNQNPLLYQLSYTPRAFHLAAIMPRCWPSASVMMHSFLRNHLAPPVGIEPT